MILIQRITTEWTKASRGGRGAIVRNSFPEAFPVPPFDTTIGPFVVHTVRFREWESFERHEDLNGFTSPTDAHIEPIRIYQHDDHIVVRFLWNWMQCGAPERDSHEIFQLVPGKWARFTCNGRFGPTSSSGCVWHYHKTVFNIAFNNSPDTDLFVVTKPQSVQNRLATLK